MPHTMHARGTRHVVVAAHRFVDGYAGENGDIPAARLFSMGHRLAHCSMSNILTFLGAYGFGSPADFERFVRRHAPERVPQPPPTDQK